MNKTYKVYTHTTPSGDVYVGVTCQDLKIRWNPSKYKTTALQPYIEKFGWKAIKHEVIYTCEDRDEAYQVEEEMRNYYTENGCCINKQRSGLIKSKDERAYDRQYYQDHKEEKSDYNRKWNIDHKEERSVYHRKYYQDHKEEKADYLRQYRQDHREEINDYNRKYYQEHKDDPYFQEKERERKRQWYQKNKLQKKKAS